MYLRLAPLLTLSLAGCPFISSSEHASNMTPPEPVCAEDAREPNNTPDAASSLFTNDTVDGQLCAGDDDWFTTDLPARCALSVDVNQTDPTVAVQLTASDGVSQWEGTGQHLDVPEGFDPSTLQIGLSASADTPYTLRLSQTCNPCIDDAWEPNDTQESPADLTVPVALSGQTCRNNVDWYRVSIPAHCSFAVDLSFVNANGDLDLTVQNDVISLTSASVDDNEHVALADFLNTDQAYLIQIAGYGGAENPYDLAVTTECLCFDDSFETANPQASVPVSLPFHAPAQTCGTNQDTYTFRVPSGCTATATATFSHADGDLDMSLSTALETLAATSQDDNETLTTTSSDVDQEYALTVYGYDGAEAPYDLTIDATCPPTTACLDDTYEPNTAASPTRLSSPTTLSGHICHSNSDHYTFAIAEGCTATAELTFTHAEGDLDMALLPSDGTPPLVSASSADHESLSYTADVSTQATLRVYDFNALSDPTLGDSTYRLELRRDCTAAPACTFTGLPPNLAVTLDPVTADPTFTASEDIVGPSTAPPASLDVRIQRFLSGAGVAPATVFLNQQTPQSCATCVSAHRDCDENGCATEFRAVEGTVTLDRLDSSADGFVSATLRDVRLAEVTRSPTGAPEWVAGGQTWCVPDALLHVPITPSTP